MICDLSVACSKAGDDRTAEALVENWSRGRTAWPDVAVDRDAFAEYLKARSTPDAHPDRILEHAVEELYLACACGMGDPAALAAFEATYFPMLDAALRRSGLGRVAIDDVKQDLRVKLFMPDPNGVCGIAKFAGRGPLKGWLRVVAIREANRRRSKLVRDSDETELSGSRVAAADAELALMKDTYRAEFRRAFGVATRSLDARARTILALHLVDGSSMKDIARIYSVHRTTVLRWIEDILESIRQRTRDALLTELSIESGEYRSILRLIGSHLDVSLGSQFAVSD